MWRDTSARSQCVSVVLLVLRLLLSDWLRSLCRLFVCSNEFSQMVAEEYLSNFNFSGLTIDQALRSALILSKLQLPWCSAVVDTAWSHGLSD